MKRRDFLAGTVAAVLVAATPLVIDAASRRPLLDDPLAWLGAEFVLADGTRLQLADVDSLVRDRHSTQMRLRFRTLSGTPPREGMHALSGRGCKQALFLQDGESGPVACINRLHTFA